MLDAAIYESKYMRKEESIRCIETKTLLGKASNVFEFRINNNILIKVDVIPMICIMSNYIY